MKKQITAILLCISLLLVGCGNIGSEQTSSDDTSDSLSNETQVTDKPSQTEEILQSESSKETVSSESTETELLTKEEIIDIFEKLNDKSNDFLKWFYKDYTQINIDGVPTHQIDNVVVRIIPSRVDPENGWESLMGSVVYAKVIEDTIPDFPWKSVDEINEALTEIFEPEALDSPFVDLINPELKDTERGIFHQFDDGLYFLTIHQGTAFYPLVFDYTNFKIIRNTSDEILFEFHQKYMPENIVTSMRTKILMKKNKDGKWRLACNPLLNNLHLE